MTQKGQALLETAVGALDVYAYVTNESLKAAQAWEEEIAKNASGADASWVPRNEHIILDVQVKLMGDTQTHVKGGAIFLAPYAPVVLSGFDLAWLNNAAAAWQYIGGSSIDIQDAKHGTATIKLRKYADTAQQLASVTAAT